MWFLLQATDILLVCTQQRRLVGVEKGLEEVGLEGIPEIARYEGITQKAIIVQYLPR